MSSNLIFLPIERQRDSNPLGEMIKAYLNFEGPNGSTDFRDLGGTSVISAAGVKITDVNPLTGTGSALFDGAAGQLFYIETGVAPQNKDFAVEAFVVFDKYSGGGGQGIFDMRADGSNSNAFGLGYDAGKFNAHFNGSTFFNTAAPVVLGQRHHLAVTVQNRMLRFFFDGTLIGSGVTNGEHLHSRIMLGGNAYVPSGYRFAGKMDEVRYTVGSARYTANFQPPVGPLHVVE